MIFLMEKVLPRSAGLDVVGEQQNPSSSVDENASPSSVNRLITFDLDHRDVTSAQCLHVLDCRAAIPSPALVELIFYCPKILRIDRRTL
jgi:hypothetical protein